MPPCLEPQTFPGATPKGICKAIKTCGAQSKSRKGECRCSFVLTYVATISDNPHIRFCSVSDNLQHLVTYYCNPCTYSGNRKYRSTKDILRDSVPKSVGHRCRAVQCSLGKSAGARLVANSEVGSKLLEMLEAVLSFHQLVENSDESFLLDNEALFLG